MKGLNRINSSTAWPIAFLLLLGLLQLALVPVLKGGDIDLVPLLRVDSLGIVFGTAWTLTLAANSIRLTRQSCGRLAGLFLGITSIALLVCAYAQNMAVLALGWVLLGLGVSAIWNAFGEPTKSVQVIFTLLSPAGILLASALISGFLPLAPPAGGVTGPWQPIPVLAAALAVVLAAVTGIADEREREGEAEQRADVPLTPLYALVAPYILAKMLVAAPWHQVGSWLLVLVGMLVVLGGVYLAYASQERGRAQAFVTLLGGASIVGFGLATNSPLAAAGATWVMLLGLPRLVAPGWRGAEVATNVAILPGLWMISQAALDTGYEVVGVLLLPAYILLASLITCHTPRVWQPWVVVPVAVSLVAVTLPQMMVEAIVRPAVRTMAGGVGALTSLDIDWGVGILIRTTGGIISAALPATGIVLAVFLAAVVLYLLKQLAERAIRTADGDTHPE